MINIQEENIRNVIQRNKNYIGKGFFPFDSICTLTAFIVTYLLSDFDGKTGTKIFLIIVIFLCAAWLLYRLFLYFRNPIDAEKLYDEIMGLVEKKHAFSLSLISNENRFLLKYDRRWKCYLFPYTRTKLENDKEFVQDCFFKLTGINKACDKVLEHEDTKYSYSDGFEKTYSHTYYLFNLDIGKSILSRKNSFKIGKDNYRWFTIQEMRENKKIEERNSEIVTFVDENF